MKNKGVPIIVERTGTQVDLHFKDQVRGPVRARVRGQVSLQVWEQVKNQVGDQVWDRVMKQVWDKVEGHIDPVYMRLRSGIQ